MKCILLTIIAAFLVTSTSSQELDNFIVALNVTDDCGNGVCDSGENCLSCPTDCISGTSGGFECGNGVCEDGETCFTCPQDCMSNEAMSGGNEPGQGFCCFGGKKNPGMAGALSCDDFRCSPPGIQCDRKDSPPVTYCCGDGVCSGEETSLNCPVDGCVELCGDGTCDEAEGENAETCPSDCACNLDGKCDSWETVSSCPLDCTCGNYVCDVDLGENVDNCSKDCACNANYQCEPWEDEKNCPRDCGRAAMRGGNDAFDGTDGLDQQFDGYGYDGNNGNNGNNDEDNDSDENCFDNNEECTKHMDCCSSACDLGGSKLCVG